jgi:hypothetical protein
MTSISFTAARPLRFGTLETEEKVGKNAKLPLLLLLRALVRCRILSKR